MINDGRSSIHCKFKDVYYDSGLKDGRVIVCRYGAHEDLGVKRKDNVFETLRWEVYDGKGALTEEDTRVYLAECFG